MDGSVPLADAARPFPSATISLPLQRGVQASGYGNSGLKRAFDVLASATLLVLCLPLMLLIAVALAASGGPVLFSQARVGRSGRLFDCYKFRSMVPDADAHLRALLHQRADLRAEWENDQKLQSDPRVTRFGSLLRRSSLDELPQLFNVLSGDMSLIGPRPVLADELRTRYGRAARWYVAVRPGITGLWQVKGRNHVSYRRRVALDCYYARRASPFLDLSILLQTFNAVLVGAGPATPRAAPVIVEPVGDNMRWAWTVVPLFIVGASAAVEWLNLGDAPRGFSGQLPPPVAALQSPAASNEMTYSGERPAASNAGAAARYASATRATQWSRTANASDAGYRYAASDGTASNRDNNAFAGQSHDTSRLATVLPAENRSAPTGALGLLSSLLGAFAPRAMAPAPAQMAPAPAQVAAPPAPAAPVETASVDVSDDGDDAELDEAPDDRGDVKPWWCDDSMRGWQGCSG